VFDLAAAEQKADYAAPVLMLLARHLPASYCSVAAALDRARSTAFSFDNHIIDI